ncbi:MAG: hypothetical protein HZT40_03975 [Candidatus Thiothrix singaporensis]|uniref:Uncharacterized protein n=1 Tax=Candidatus Thiothrix singaporensis TaxID=2799669 RepID=A0A7L6APA2_9GAMM|nr:MAG: hypothetical protein HZT40_03975 [Candidatus Thiothrix singaporensis]
MLGYGMAGTATLGMGGLLVATAVAMAPLLKYRRKDGQQPDDDESLITSNQVNLNDGIQKLKNRY